MLRSLLLFCICMPMFCSAQSEWEISSNGTDNSFFCYDITARNGKVFSSGTKELNGQRVSVLHVSNDRGKAWEEVPMKGIPPNIALINLCYTGKRLIGVFGLLHPTGPMLSDDDGRTWRLPDFGIDTIHERVLQIIYVSPSELIGIGYLPATDSHIFYNSKDTGNTWTKRSMFTPPDFISNVQLVGNKLFAPTWSVSNGNGMYVSSNMAVSWKINTAKFNGKRLGFDMITGDGKNLLIFGEQSNADDFSIFSSGDSGLSWVEFPHSVKNVSFPGSPDGFAYDDGVYYASLRIGYYSKMFVSKDVLSVKEAQYKNLALYPNPASDQLNISLPDKGAVYNAAVFNMQGKCINTFQMKGQTLDVSGLSQGIYMLKISDGLQYYISKFIKE